MRIKVSAAILAFLLIISLFAGCTSEPEPEIASQHSDGDAAKIDEEFSHISEQLNMLEEVSDTNSPEDFKAAIENTENTVASYAGEENITLSLGSKLSKTVEINTTGAVSVDSEMSSLILSGAAGGFTANARIDSLIINGTDITADIKSAAGSVYIKGKNVTVNVTTDEIEKIVVNNIYTTVNNLTEAVINVTLTNGAKVRVPAQTTYNALNNTLQKYTPAD